MDFEDFGRLVKLKIVSVNTGDFFEAMFNPESYSEAFSNEHRIKKTVNSAKGTVDNVNSNPQNFNLKITIDGTGVSQFHTPYLPGFYNEDRTVYDKVNQFLALTWWPTYNGQKNNVLVIKWGEFVLNCILKDVKINYSLFNRKGLPLRAELDANFLSYEDDVDNKSQYKKRFGAPQPLPGQTGTGQTGTGQTGTGPNGTVQPGTGQNLSGAGPGGGGVQNGITIKVS